MVGTNTKTARKADWSLTHRGVVSSTALTAAGLIATAGVGEIAHVNPVWAGLGAGVGALGHLVVSAQRAHTSGAILYRLGCWAGAGSWLTWNLVDPHQWWNVNGLAAMAVGAIGAAIFSPIANHKRDQDAPSRALVLRNGGKLGEEWMARFRRVCRVNVRVTEVQQWPNGAGYDLHCQLPPGPATRKQIASAAEALAADARLPEGCSVEPKPGRNRGAFILAVATVNRLGSADDAEPVKLHYPADYSPRSILQQVDLGEHRDANVAGVHLREDSVLAVARKGGGKTNLLDVLTLGIGRCRDALVWHVDMNGGGMSQFWLHPWLQGETDRPPIDWAASTPEEALYMVTLALAIAKDRKSSYRTFKAEANSKLLPISDKLPEIVVMVDEGAEVLSPTNRDPITRQVRDGLEEIQRIARNEAVNVVISSLRPTQDMISPNILKQSAIRLAMYGLDEPDLGHLYNWPRGISMEDLPTSGCAFLGVMPRAPRPMKAWFLEPSQIKQAAVAIAGYRPELDEASTDIADAEYEIDLGGRRPEKMSDIYAGRYERMRMAFTGQAAPAPVVETVEPEPAGPTPLRLLTGGAANWPDPLPARRTAAPASASASDWPDPPIRRPIATTAPAGVLTAPPVQPIPEILVRALAEFDRAGAERMHSETLAAALGVESTNELPKLLGGLDVRTLPEAFIVGGKRARGYARQALAEAAERVARGEIDVPDVVAAWPAA
jgi:hypothetical protein